MAKFNDIRELAQQNARWVSNSPKDWMNYLDVAARLYRYSFKDTLLIHAQRPDATACAELEVWNKKIHDYFIAKSLDLVRPGGVVAVVTSSGTMDKKDSSVREYLANRADLVGAIRLPNNAFQRNANTSVVADILFLQKRDRAAVERAEWVDLGTTPEGYPINQYFAQHPEMVLGEITTESTQYGKQETTVKPIEGADLAQQLKAAVENIHAEITEPEITDDELDQNAEPLSADPNVKNFSYTNVDGQVYYRENSYMNKVDLPAVTAERVLGMIALRETTQKLLDCQLHDGTDAEVELLQGKLKDQYKRFTAQYGLINSTANKRAWTKKSVFVPIWVRARPLRR